MVRANCFVGSIREHMVWSGMVRRISEFCGLPGAAEREPAAFIDARLGTQRRSENAAEHAHPLYARALQVYEALIAGTARDDDFIAACDELVRFLQQDPAVLKNTWLP